MSFDFNTFEEGTASPAAEAKPKVEPRVVERLRGTLRPADAPPDWQQPALRYEVTGKNAAEITKAQGRLNSIGRRYGVEFSVKTQRVEADGRAFIEAFAVPKRAPKPRGKR